MKEPLKVGTKTNKGIIRSYKLVRFGYGKYRYWIGDKDYKIEELKIIK